MIEINLKNDLTEHLQNDLKTNGVDFDSEDILLSWLSYQKKVIPTNKRAVFLSPELIERDEDRVNIIAEKLKNGECLKEYLSKNIFKQKNDLLLNDWGIHHIHFEPKGTKDLLFAFIVQNAAFLITIMPHEKEGSDFITWANKDLIQIIYDNWPKLIEPHELHGISGENITNEEKKKFRRLHCNSVITLANGKTYGPLGGGIASSGDSVACIIQKDWINNNLKVFEDHIKLNELKIRDALETGDEVPLYLKISFQENINVVEKLLEKTSVAIESIVLYEPSLETGIYFNLIDG
jgi:hypothetical protein